MSNGLDLQVNRNPLGFSDVVWNGFFATVATIIIAYMSHRTANSVDANKTAVDQAKEAIVEHTQEVKTAVQRIPEAAAMAADKLVEQKPQTKE